MISCLQNILVGNYLKKRAQKQVDEQDDDEPEDMRQSLKKQPSKKFGRGKSEVGEDSSQPFSRGTTRRGVFSHNRKGKRQTWKEEESVEKERPAFQTDWHSHASTKKSQPRAVVIPYGRLKKDRFFDWPPDPTVSRATPINSQQNGVEADSLTESVREPLIEEINEITANSSIRRRKKSGDVGEAQGIPGNISF